MDLLSRFGSDLKHVISPLIQLRDHNLCLVAAILFHVLSLLGSTKIYILVKSLFVPLIMVITDMFNESAQCPSPLSVFVPSDAVFL